MISIENSVILCINAVGMIPSSIQSLCLQVTILTLKDFGAGLTQSRGLEHQFLHCLMLDTTFRMMLRKLMLLISTFTKENLSHLNELKPKVSPATTVDSVSIFSPDDVFNELTSLESCGPDCITPLC